MKPRPARLFVAALATAWALVGVRVAPAADLAHNDDSLGTGAACPVPVLVVSRTCKGLEPDSTWYGFGPAVAGARARHRANRWIVDYTWFRTLKEPRRLRRFGEMDSLQAAGLIDSTTKVGTVTWRAAVTARSAREAMVEAQRTAPKTIPARLQAAVH